MAKMAPKLAIKILAPNPRRNQYMKIFPNFLRPPRSPLFSFLLVFTAKLNKAADPKQAKE
jgi:hypothetical protein